MRKRSSKKLRAKEVNQIAVQILQAATGGAAPLTIEGTKNPAAAPSRSRPLKGGKARAESRGPAQRAQKAKKAVAARRKAK